MNITLLADLNRPMAEKMEVSVCGRADGKALSSGRQTKSRGRNGDPLARLVVAITNSD